MKLFLQESCVVDFADDKGGQHRDAGEVIEVRKDVGQALVAIGRALYFDAKDDPSEAKAYTVDPKQLKKAAAEKAAADKAAA